MASEEEYTDDDRPPQSSVPADVQLTVMMFFFAVLFCVIAIAICMSRQKSLFYAELNNALRFLSSYSCNKKKRRTARSAGLGSKNPLLSSRAGWLVSFRTRHQEPLAPMTGRVELCFFQSYVLTWKCATEKARSKTALATYFGLPLMGLFTPWLLYAVFSSKHSSGELEQYLTALSLVFVTQSVCANVVAEKALKLTESLRQMGLDVAAYWTSLVFVENIAMGTPLAILLASIATPLRLFHNVGRGYTHEYDSGEAWTDLFLLFWSYCAASVGLAIFISVFCASPSTASLASFGVTIASIATFMVLRMSAADTLRDYLDAFLLCPPLALTLCFVGMSSTFGRYPVDFKVHPRKVAGFLVVDAIMLTVLAAYLSKIVPSEHGTTEPFWYPVTGLINRLKRRRTSTTTANYAALVESSQQSFASNPMGGDDEDDDEEKQQAAKTALALAEDGRLSPKEVQENSGSGVATTQIVSSPTVSIRSMRKSFGAHVALDDVSLELFEGEVLALLGHNGAGKSTLISVLTRLLSYDGETRDDYAVPSTVNFDGGVEYADLSDISSRGATIYGLDLTHPNIRRFLGVCPQHDVLFERVTAREHTALCSAIKSGEIEAFNAEGDSLLRTFGLQDRYDHLGKELSGGMRRKLSTACALVGGSRFVILDEPSTGLDPLARRELWDLISSVKKGRTLLLSTHYMDEAMVLGDKVAILRHGRVVCHAPPEDVARDLGEAGYKLSCDLRPIDSVSSDNDGAQARDEMPGSGHSSDDDVQLTSIATASMLPSGDGPKASLKEDALTAFVQTSVPGAAPWRDEAGRVDGLRKVYGLPANKAIEIGNLVAALEADAKEGGERFGILAVGLGATDLEDAFMRVGGAGPPPDENDVEITMSLLGAPTASSSGAVEKVDVRKSIARSAARVWALCQKRLRIAVRDWKTIPLLLVPVGGSVAAFALNADDKFGNRGSAGANIATIVVMMLAFVPTAGLLAEHVTSERSTKLRNVLTVAGCDAKCYVAGTFAGDFVFFAIVAALVASIAVTTGAITNAYSETIEYSFPRDVDKIPDSVFHRAIKQYVHSDAVDDEFFPDDDAWIPATKPDWLYTVNDDTVRDIEHNLTRDGIVNITTDDWRTYELHETDDGIARWDTPSVWVFLPLFVVHLLAFSYASSHLFSSPREAVVLLPMMVIGLLFLPVVAISLFNLTLGKQGVDVVHVSKSTFLGCIFWGLALCSPHGNMFVALANLTTTVGKRFANQYPSFSSTCAIAIIEAVFYLIVTYVLDRRVAQARIPRVVYDAPRGDDTAEDDDVVCERHRVDDLYASTAESTTRMTSFPPLAVVGLRKVYRTPSRASKAKKVVVAVDNLSLAVGDGEIFGLLGANGSGKTSAISCIMRSTYPTAGDALICGHSVLDDFERAARHLGVVTQNDTVYDRLTCLEHCALFASIRGGGESRGKQDEGHVDAVLAALDLDTPLIRSKLARHLSGGQRRKLVTACSIVGNPRVCLLDEPSAGLDPVSRRHLQSAVRRATLDRAAVLTSHSMEESEALCTRLAILVKGKMHAIGTSTHLKRKFVSEYRLTARCPPSVETESVRDWIVDALPQAQPRPSAKLRTVNLAVRDADVSHAFKTLEDAKRDDLVESYTLSQPSLEQVFITVVKSASGSSEADDVLLPSSPSSSTVSAEEAMEEADASAIVEAQTCCGCNHRAHCFLALGAALCAFCFFIALTGLVGDGVSYDDDNRDYDDDAKAIVGCHRQKNVQSPCSTSSVTLASFPFVTAIIVSVVGCCGCCCCLRPPPRRED